MLARPPRFLASFAMGVALVALPARAENLIGRKIDLHLGSKPTQAVIKFAKLIEQHQIAYAVAPGEEVPAAELVAIFDAQQSGAPKCHAAEKFSMYYGWTVERFEARKSRKPGYFVVISGTGGEGGGQAQELVVGHLTPSCKFTQLMRREVTRECGPDRKRGRAASGELYMLCRGALLDFSVSAAGELSIRSIEVERESVTRDRTPVVIPSNRISTERIDLERL